MSEADTTRLTVWVARLLFRNFFIDCFCQYFPKDKGSEYDTLEKTLKFLEMRNDVMFFSTNQSEIILNQRCL